MGRIHRYPSSVNGYFPVATKPYMFNSRLSDKESYNAENRCY